MNIEQKKAEIQSVMRNAQAEFENVGKQIAELSQRQQYLREVYLRAEGGLATLAELEAAPEQAATATV
jgi:phosphoserine aminotransferase